MHFNELPSSHANLEGGGGRGGPISAHCCRGADKVALECVEFWLDEIKSDSVADEMSLLLAVLSTCVIWAFLIGCWDDRLDWLAEDHC